MQMRRTQSLLLTIAFLGAQILSFAHAAECSSREHKHEGDQCEICINAKYQDYTDPVAAGEIRIAYRAQCVQQPSADIIVVRDSREAGITRGPPTPS